jgi:2-oxoisovalerate dehydrogenase E1 component alpha subunit
LITETPDAKREAGCVDTDGPLAVLNEDGSCAEEHRDLIDDDGVLAVLDVMVLNRVLDRRFLSLQRQGRLGFYMTSTGEEATTIGSAWCLSDEDPIFLSYRELGSVLWRGVPLEVILNQFIGNSQDPNRGRQMPIHHSYRDWSIPSVSSPVGTQLPHACGFAYAAKLRGTSQVALAFLGEGTASQGDFHTAVNFSGVFNVPAIYVIRNNGYAISTPESVQTAAPVLAVRGEGYGVPGIQVDGNDFLAVIRVVGEAVERARRGEGPALIEALTYRIGAHSTADDPSAYRSEEELERWQQLDPLARLAAHARWRGIWDDEREARSYAKHEERVSQVIAECERWPPPPLESLFEDVTETLSAQLREQRDAYLRYWRARRSELEEVP